VTRSATHARVRLKYRAHVEMGQSPPSAEYAHSPEDGLPFLQGTADFGLLTPVPSVYCPNPTKVAESGDVLFSVRAPVGELNVANQEVGIGRGLCAIRAGASWVPRFGWWALHEARHQLNYVSTGSTYEAVATEDVANLLVEHTTLDEQRAIADFLDRETAQIDTLVAAKERLLELLAEKRRALITHAVTQGLDPKAPLRNSGIPWLGPIPAHWEIVALRFLASMTSGGTPDTQNPEFWDGEIPWVSPKDMKRDEIADSEDHVSPQALEETALKMIPVDAVLVVVRGMILAHSFPVAVTVGEVTINQDMKALVCGPRLSPRFLFNYLCGSERHIVSLGDSSAHGTKKLGADTLGRLEVCIPPPKEQRGIVANIVAETAKLDALRRATERSLALLKERRLALIAAAVSGRISVA